MNNFHVCLRMDDFSFVIHGKLFFNATSSLFVGWCRMYNHLFGISTLMPAIRLKKFFTS